MRCGAGHVCRRLEELVMAPIIISGGIVFAMLLVYKAHQQNKER